jgi:hypothetical protein
MLALCSICCGLPSAIQEFYVSRKDLSKNKDNKFLISRHHYISNMVKQQEHGVPAPFVYEAGWKLVPRAGQHVLVPASDLYEDEDTLELRVMPAEAIVSTSKSPLVHRRSISKDSESVVQEVVHEDV